MPATIFTDQLTRQVHMPHVPKRIISLVPSITELLFDLELENEIVGVTRFCVHPASARQQKSTIGGTKKFDFAKIDELTPDLIIGNKEENYEEGIDRLSEKYPVWMSDVNSFRDAIHLITQLGALTSRKELAQSWAQKIESAFAHAPFFPPMRVLYLIWQEPWMAVANDTYIHAMLNKCGWVNVLAGTTRYPVLTSEEIKALSPDLILLPSEPYPFQEKHRETLLAVSPGSKVVRVDGEMFSWYGSRMVKAAAYFRSLAV